MWIWSPPLSVSIKYQFLGMDKINKIDVSSDLVVIWFIVISSLCFILRWIKEVRGAVDIYYHFQHNILSLNNQKTNIFLYKYQKLIIYKMYQKSKEIYFNQCGLQINFCHIQS